MSQFWNAVEQALEEKSLSPKEVLENSGSLLEELVLRTMEIIPWPCSFGVENPGMIHPVNDGEMFIVMDVGDTQGVLHITNFHPGERVQEVLELLSDNQVEE